MSSLSEMNDRWLHAQLPGETLTVHPLLGDASSRQYCRVRLANQSYILMVAPNPEHKTAEFINLAKALRPMGVNVPHVYAHDLTLGVALLEDFGDTLLLSKLNASTMRSLYAQAAAAITKLQTAEIAVPNFDETHTYLELSYFSDWYLDRLLGMKLTGGQQSLLASVNEILAENICVQPQVLVHRDYHARNILCLPNDQLGIIDFQDAMRGPVTYDLVSLLKDCYVAWPETEVEHCVFEHWERSRADYKRTPYSFDTFLEWFDLTGLQRHLKVLGIFSRLNLRDNKAQYLKDIPRILCYVIQTTAKYPVLSDFHDFCTGDMLQAFQTYCDTHAMTSDIKVA